MYARLLLSLGALLLGLLPLPAHAAPSRSTASERPPVLVIAGTFQFAGDIQHLADYFSEHGLRASVIQLAGAIPGSDAITTSADQIAERVSQIRRTTGSSQVMLVGYSQGALAMREYVRYHGGLDVVPVAISLGGPNYGDNTAYACPMFQACRDMWFGSAFLRHLNAGFDTPGDLRWIHLYSTDAVYENIPLEGAENLAVQSRCPDHHVEHVDEPRDGAMRELMLDALLGRQDLTTTCPQ